MEPRPKLTSARTPVSNLLPVQFTPFRCWTCLALQDCGDAVNSCSHASNQALRYSTLHLSQQCKILNREVKSMNSHAAIWLQGAVGLSQGGFFFLSQVGSCQSQGGILPPSGGVGLEISVFAAPLIIVLTALALVNSLLSMFQSGIVNVPPDLQAYTVSKSVPSSSCYNFDTHKPILIIFGRIVAQKVGKQCFIFLITMNRSALLKERQSTALTLVFVIFRPKFYYSRCCKNPRRYPYLSHRYNVGCLIAIVS